MPMLLGWQPVEDFEAGRVVWLPGGRQVRRREGRDLLDWGAEERKGG